MNDTWPRLFLLPIFLAAISMQLSASTIVPLGLDQTISAGRTGPQRNPDVAMAPDGSALVVWADGGTEIVGQRVDATGALLGASFAISLPGEQVERARVRFEPTTASYIVVWNLRAADGTLAGRQVTAGELGPAFRIVDAAAQDASAFDFDVDRSGRALAVWYSSSELRVLAQGFLPSGLLSGPIIEVSTAEALGDTPTVAATGTDAFRVAWGHSSAPENGPLWMRFVQDSQVSNSVAQLGTGVDPRAIDGLHLVWTRTDAERVTVETRDFLPGPANPLAGQRTHFSSERIRSTGATGGFDASERVLLAWSVAQNGSDAGVDGGDIWARTGEEPRGRATRLNATPGGSQRKPAVAGGPDGLFVAVWEDADEDATEEPRITMRRVRVASVTCREDANAVCLRGGRFRVEADWESFGGQTGRAAVIPFGTPTSALFSFFDRDNWELQVKVVDGCANNGHFWVFAAATTNVAYELRITDIGTGARATYVNPLGVSSPAITDTRALACP